MKKVLVTGGAGFVGGPLCRSLTAAGYDVLAYDNFFNGRKKNVEGIPYVEGDIRNYAHTEETVKEFGPAVIINLAALHFIPYCNAHPVETVDVNTRGAAGVFEIAKQAGVERLISISTAAVYPPSDTAHSEGDPARPMDIYGVSKLQTEELLKLYQLQSGRSAINVRLFNVYGARDTNPHLLPDILKQLPSTDMLELGNVEPKRDYIYMDDVVEGFKSLLEYESPAAYECFNLGTGKEYSVVEMVEQIGELLGRPLKIRPSAARKRRSERMHLLADNRRIMKKTGWRPRFSLRDGLEATLRDEGLLH